TENNTWCFSFDRHFKFLTGQRTFTVDRLTKRINYTTQHAFAYHYRSNTLRTANCIAFFNAFAFAKKYCTYVIFFQVHHDGAKTVLELDQLTRLYIGKAVNAGNPVTYLKYRTYFFQFTCILQT